MRKLFITVIVFDRKFQQIQKSCGMRIAEAKGNQLVSNKNPVSMNSIEDLMKIADELGKPVVHQSEGPSGDIHIYMLSMAIPVTNLLFPVISKSRLATSLWYFNDTTCNIPNKS